MEINSPSYVEVSPQPPNEDPQDSNNSLEKIADTNYEDVGPDDTDDDVRKLFVGGLSWETTEEDLKKYFSQWGNVTRCIIKVDRFTGNSRGFGFVTFDDEDSVNKVLNIPEHKLKNKRIDPKKAKPSREVIKKIFVGGIDPDLTKDNIMEYFEQFGQVESLDLPFDAQRGKRKHYIFVSFSTEAAAKKAIAKDRQEIYGRQCDVRVAVTREQSNRNKGVKFCYGCLDPTYGYPYGEYNNAYNGFDPYAYGYYGYDYFGAASPAAGYGPFPGYENGQFRSQIGNNKSNPVNFSGYLPNRGISQPHTQANIGVSLNDQTFCGLNSVKLSDLSCGDIQHQ